MSAVKTYFMRCDLCGYTDEEGNETGAVAARRSVREAGWTRPRVPGSRDLKQRIDSCPTCSEDDQ